MFNQRVKMIFTISKLKIAILSCIDYCAEEKSTRGIFCFFFKCLFAFHKLIG